MRMKVAPRTLLLQVPYLKMEDFSRNEGFQFSAERSSDCGMTHRDFPIEIRCTLYICKII